MNELNCYQRPINIAKAIGSQPLNSYFHPLNLHKLNNIIYIREIFSALFIDRRYEYFHIALHQPCSTGNSTCHSVFQAYAGAIKPGCRLPEPQQEDNIRNNHLRWFQSLVRLRPLSCNGYIVPAFRRVQPGWLNAQY